MFGIYNNTSSEYSITFMCMNVVPFLCQLLEIFRINDPIYEFDLGRAGIFNSSSFVESMYCHLMLYRCYFYCPVSRPAGTIVQVHSKKRSCRSVI